MKKTLEELLQLERNQSTERYRQEKSVNLGYCPVCGSNLVKIKRKRWFDKLLGNWHERNFCPVNKSHYDHSGTYFDGNDVAF